MRLVELFPELSLNPANSKEIKQWILRLALQGQLTKSYAERYTKKKTRISFQAFTPPLHWSIEYFKNICDFKMGKTPPSKEPIYWDGQTPWVSIADMEQNGIISETKKTLSKEGFKYSFNNVICKKGTLLMSFKLTIGKTSILGIDACHNEAIISIYPYETISQKYLFWFLPILSNIGPQVSALMGNTLNKGKLEELVIPVPPLEEQNAIVSIVEALFKEVDELETQTKQRIELKHSYASSILNRLSVTDTPKEWKQIVSVFPEIFNDKETIKTLRETILQLAVQGGLTSEWRRINQSSIVDLERLESLRYTYQQKAINNKGQKSFKYQKAVNISINEKSKGVDNLFELPSNWSWSSLGQMSWSISDGPHFSPKYVEDGVPMLSARNISFANGLDFRSAKYISEEDHLEYTKRGIPEIGDVILSKGGTTGIPAVIETEKQFSIWVHLALIKIIKEYVNPYYLRYALASPYVYKQSQAQTHGIGNKDLGLTRMIYFAIPLPPLEEQSAIVEKVNSLMSFCDELEANITISQKQSELLLKQVLKESLQSKVEIEQIEQRSIPNLRQQLALHIIYKSAADASFGKTKFEKLLHLSDYHIIKQDWGQKYERHTAGPLDTAFTYPFLATAQSNDWISYDVKGNLERICANRSVVEKQLKENPLPKEIADQVDNLIDKFIGHNYETPEIVSTLYAVWNNRMIRNEEITDELLKADFLAWDKQKLRYKDRLDKVIKTMQEEGLVPDGWGKVIDKKN